MYQPLQHEQKLRCFVATCVYSIVSKCGFSQCLTETCSAEFWIYIHIFLVCRYMYSYHILFRILPDQVFPFHASADFLAPRGNLVYTNLCKLMCTPITSLYEPGCIAGPGLGLSRFAHTEYSFTRMTHDCTRRRLLFGQSKGSVAAVLHITKYGRIILM